MPELVCAVQHMCGNSGHCRFAAVETGAAGDCCYLAIAAGLQAHVVNNPSTALSFCTKLGLKTVDDQVVVADALRRAAGRRFSKHTEEELLNAALSYVAQYHVREQWYDTYSPKGLLRQCGLECLLTASNVVAVSANEDSHPGDILVQIEDGAGLSVLAVADGARKIAQLREKFRGIYSMPCRKGGWHWGTHEDIGAISQQLDIGFIVFPNKPQGANGWRLHTES